MYWVALSTALSGKGMLTVYRTLKAKYLDEPLATEGARLYGGRWNPKGYPLLYTTSSPALALIESLVHQPRVRYEKLPALHLITLSVPENVRYLASHELPDYWNEERYERTQWILKPWLDEPETLVMGVPSAAVPMSYNYLIHPHHGLFAEIQVIKTEEFPVERRLWSEGNI
jgi:RES domain-containing protein